MFESRCIPWIVPSGSIVFVALAEPRTNPGPTQVSPGKVGVAEVGVGQRGGVEVSVAEVLSGEVPTRQIIGVQPDFAKVLG